MKCILLISGSRGYQGEYALVSGMVLEVARGFISRMKRYGRDELVLMHGDCAHPKDSSLGYSIDQIGGHVGESLKMRVERRPADWHPGGGALDRSAGPKRNSAMVRECLEERARGALVEVHCFPGDGPGTKDLIRKARAAGLHVTVHLGGRRSTP